MKLSILIPTLPKRKHMFDELIAELQRQSEGREIEILYDATEGVSIGSKRNTLLQKAEGEYVCFIDDDDMVCPDYITLVMGGVESDDKPDVLSLRGIITENGKNPRQFIHSIEYKSYFERDKVLYRCPNHLNVMRADIAKQFDFISSNYGEDTEWAMRICKSGLLQKEYVIDETLYYYRYVRNK